MKDKAQEIMKMIEKKLNGQVGKHAAAKLPLSTEGQVIPTITFKFNSSISTFYT